MTQRVKRRERKRRQAERTRYEDERMQAWEARVLRDPDDAMDQVKVALAICERINREKSNGK